MIRGVLFLLTALSVASCGGLKLEDFKQAEPALKLEEYFVGQLKAWGHFQDRFDNVRRRFTVDIEGTWDGETLTLVEDFVYDDGETEQRIWTLRKTGPEDWEGSAAGVVGTAKGKVSGNALNWTYYFDLPVGDSTLRVKFDDWLWLQDERVMINRAYVSKFGIKVGEALIFFSKEPAQESGLEGESSDHIETLAEFEPREHLRNVKTAVGGGRF
ncbi:DUF3833 domain-containing protein [Denitrobaculum tricleocarpae]|uniref:DUF3833 domain-containing protein n=1 Tax=Denitrobaculum tricleocarpae TaxID=2591009 RepID=A0A545TF45_9PROT|nr:DUF3833 domain-containing protein [Denitrobaculum tricleocarpae]TQV75853.1 DUF3833 domain-containing protein [Denitrobaculum tricleocarpae]